MPGRAQPVSSSGKRRKRVDKKGEGCYPVERRLDEQEVASVREDLVRLGVERLAEDETLRGDLSDRGYAPLLDWAFSRAEGLAAQAEGAPDPQTAMEAYTGRLRAALREATRAAASGNVGDLAEQLVPPILSPEQISRAQAVLAGLVLEGNPDENAVALAGVLRSATQDADHGDGVTPQDRVSAPGVTEDGCTPREVEGNEPS